MLHLDGICLIFIYWYCVAKKLNAMAGYRDPCLCVWEWERERKRDEVLNIEDEGIKTEMSYRGDNYKTYWSRSVRNRSPYSHSRCISLTHEWEVGAVYVALGIIINKTLHSRLFSGKWPLSPSFCKNSVGWSGSKRFKSVNQSTNQLINSYFTFVDIRLYFDTALKNTFRHSYSFSYRFGAGE